MLLAPLPLMALAPAVFAFDGANDAQAGIAHKNTQSNSADLNAAQSVKPNNDKEDQISFSADNLDYDSENDIITADGNVNLYRDGYSLFADQIIWNRKTGEVNAIGNVRSVDNMGNSAFGDNIALTDSLKDGAIENLLVILENGGRLAAQKGSRVNGRLFLDSAAYTACAVVDSHGCDKNPTWQINARKVVFDPDKKRVRYEGAVVKLFGLPLLPLPGLSHPAGIDAGSGFLVPDIGYDRNNGAELTIPYYFRISDQRDLEVAASLYTETAPLIRAKFRSLEKNGAFQIQAYGTFGDRLSPISAVEDSGARGYIEGSGSFYYPDDWKISGSLRLSSDRTFLRRYDISRDDLLRSNINIENIKQNRYFSINGWAFQTLRSNDSQSEVPIALPEIDYRQIFNSPIMGGTVELQANSLLIARPEGQDTQRAFASAKWQKSIVTNMGQLIDFTLLGRTDIYHSSDNLLTDVVLYRGASGWQSRGIFSSAVDIKWPFIGKAFGGVQNITPRVQIVATPFDANLSIPNEDSRSLELETSNLFALNRFAGYDRFEDSYRITYGVDWSLETKNVQVNANLGQSYRLSNRSSIFPDGTGLANKVSDFVGRYDVRFKDFLTLSQRFRLDKDSFAVRRNEVDATIGSKETYFQMGYLRLNRNNSLQLEDIADREEIRLGARVKIGKFWSIFGSTNIDLTGQEEDPLTSADGYEPIRHRLGFSYDDDCLSFGLTWRRDYQPSGDARAGNSFLFRLAFRNLGV
ncbi:organic solvent tolerance protein [Sphingorhabdus lutea]|uniref:LPS-assembly protein LptD n=1 Tax=Sphingorhabdus lutea TaxID=1913578 RepID=A0A1L3JF15_9SPHN|nr:organic solvent tolerance protein [Sphingorhabdus lutea]